MEATAKQSVFFVGIGGSGMNGIARIMCHQNHDISGSDRDNDSGNRQEFYSGLRQLGVKLFPQDGSGINPSLDFLVTSTAIEAEIPDIVAARAANIPILHRSEALNNLVSPLKSVAVAGTSGKSTVTGMAGWCLKNAGLDPMMVNGARVIDLMGPGQDTDILSGRCISVFEADESDGSLVTFKPQIGILTNITLDHMPMEKLRDIFSIFSESIQDVLIYNADCPEASSIGAIRAESIGFGISQDADFRYSSVEIKGLSTTFSVEGQKISLKVPGQHNVENAMAVYSLLRHLNVSPKDCRDLLSSFKGIHRRFQRIGSVNSVTVFDDFAHNPDKLRATISVATQLDEPCTFIFQPHGFGPTRFLFDDLIEVFASQIKAPHNLILTPIFYAGGTVTRDISSQQLADHVNSRGGNCQVMSRNQIPEYIRRQHYTGRYIVVMGARDPSLTPFCRTILNNLDENHVS